MYYIHQTSNKFQRQFCNIQSLGQNLGSKHCRFVVNLCLSANKRKKNTYTKLSQMCPHNVEKLQSASTHLESRQVSPSISQWCPLICSSYVPHQLRWKLVSYNQLHFIWNHVNSDKVDYVLNWKIAIKHICLTQTD